MKKVSTIFALVVLFFFCGSILLKMTFKAAKADYEIIKAEFINAVKEKLPLKAEEKIQKSKKSEEFAGYNFYSRIRSKIIKKTESYSTDSLIFYEIIVQVGNYSNFLLGNKILPNNVVDLGDGYLAYPAPILKDLITNIDTFVQKVAYFKHDLDSIGIPLAYAYFPNVICDDDKVKTFTTKQAKLELMEKLQQMGVFFIDWTKECRHSNFYKTDHHWQGKTVIWAGQTISKKLNERYGFDLNVELLDTNNFTEKLAGKWLGSLGRKIIPLYEKENFYTYSPKYATDINWLLANNFGFFQSRGSFDSLYHFLDFSKESKGYQAYWFAYPTLSFSQNYNLPDGKKVLLIGDSFSESLSKFLSLVFKEVYLISRNTPSSLLDDYLANKPDIVLLCFGGTLIF